MGKVKKNQKKKVMIFTHVVALSFKVSAFVQQSDNLTKRDWGKKKKNKRGDREKGINSYFVLTL